MATELDELHCAKLLAVRAMGKKGPGSILTTIFPFEFANPHGHDVLFASISYDSNRSIKVSTRTKTNMYRGDSTRTHNGNMIVRTANNLRIGQISQDHIFCHGVMPEQLLIQYVDNSCVNVYRYSDGIFGTHAATIVGNEVNEVVVLNFMDITMTVNEKMLVLFATLRMFRYHFNFNKKPMRFFLSSEDEQLNERLLGHQNKIPSALKLLLRPYGYSNNQSKIMECFADGGNVICVATWFIVNRHVMQRIQRITGKIIFTSCSSDVNTSESKIYTEEEYVIGNVKDGIISMHHIDIPDLEITRRKTGPMAYLIRCCGDEFVFARITKETGNCVQIEFSPQLTQKGRYGVMHVAIHYAITTFKIFDGVLPTVHHYPFLSKS